jgi:hypothetical protein
MIVIRIKILIMGHFLLILRISMGHSLIFFVNISDFIGKFSNWNVINGTWPPLIPITESYPNYHIPL